MADTLDEKKVLDSTANSDDDVLAQLGYTQGECASDGSLD